MKSAKDKAADAKRRRLWILFRITPEEHAKIKDYERRYTPILLMGSRNIPEGVMGVDHRHTNGQVRGLLSSGINKALGIIENLFAERTGEVLHALAAYYDNPPAVTVLGGKRYGMTGRAQLTKKNKLYGPNGTKQ